jgi:hypothetical protein
MDSEKQERHLTAADPETAEAEELFVVDGLPGDDSEVTDLFSLMAAGPPGAESPLDLRDDSAVVAELSHSGLEEVEFNAAAGDIAAVEPPSSEVVEEAAVAGEGIEELALPAGQAMASWLSRPWAAGALAAAVVLALGGFVKFFVMAPQPVLVGTTANQPPAEPNRAPAGWVIDAACQPRAAAATEAPPRPALPEAAPPVEWVAAPPVPASEIQPEPAQPEPEKPVGNVVDPSLPVNTMAPAGTPAESEAKASFGRGAEVIVKLRNGNLFNGRLERFTPSEARLNVGRGEIEFTTSEYDVVVPLAQAPSNKGPEAIVQLQNGNRIAGRLSEDGKSRVRLAIGSSEVTIPRVEIASVELKPALGLVLSPADLEKRGTGKN